MVAMLDKARDVMPAKSAGPAKAAPTKPVSSVHPAKALAGGFTYSTKGII